LGPLNNISSLVLVVVITGINSNKDGTLKLYVDGVLDATAIPANGNQSNVRNLNNYPLLLGGNVPCTPLVAMYHLLNIR
jgi:hypothetical protein